MESVPTKKKKQAEEIRQQREAFLAKGGEINVIPNGVSGLTMDGKPVHQSYKHLHSSAVGTANSIGSRSRV